VRLVSPIGCVFGGSGNLSTSSSNVARLAAHPKCVWVFNANCDGTIIYNDPVVSCGHLTLTFDFHSLVVAFVFVNVLRSFFSCQISRETGSVKRQSGPSMRMSKIVERVRELI
jgi:hypothetical protein